ncbi:unnamed protein product [Symbiodinium sp. CCMP2592]|nr:unnamed protein product [Symbiodinium sp. CCMP2592]
MFSLGSHSADDVVVDVAVCTKMHKTPAKSASNAPTPRMRLLCAAAALAAVFTLTREAAFSQPSSLRGHSPSFQPVRGEIHGAESRFVGQSYNFGSTVAVPGCALGLALVTLMAKKGWRLKSRAKWRKAVNSQNRGRVGYRADRRPPLFGPEKPPHEGKRIYHYYCNKIYKVIRFSAATDVAPASASQVGSDWIQQKFAAWFPTRAPGFSGKMASAVCFSMCALLFCYRFTA